MNEQRLDLKLYVFHRHSWTACWRHSLFIHLPMHGVRSLVWFWRCRGRIHHLICYWNLLANRNDFKFKLKVTWIDRFLGIWTSRSLLINDKQAEHATRARHKNGEHHQDNYKRLKCLFRLHSLNFFFFSWKPLHRAVVVIWYFPVPRLSVKWLRAARKIVLCLKLLSLSGPVVTAIRQWQ